MHRTDARCMENEKTFVNYSTRIKSQTAIGLQPHAYPYRKEGVGSIDNAVAKVLLSCDWQANMRTAKPIGGCDKTGLRVRQIRSEGVTKQVNKVTICHPIIK